MDINTGKIEMFNQDDEIPKNFIEIMRDQMTEKQKKTMQVSKYDNRSELGQLFLKERRKRIKKAKKRRKK